MIHGAFDLVDAGAATWAGLTALRARPVEADPPSVAVWAARRVAGQLLRSRTRRHRVFGRRLFIAGFGLMCLSSSSCLRAVVGMPAAARETRPSSFALRKTHQLRQIGLGVGGIEPSDVRRGLFLVGAGILTAVVVVRSSSAALPFAIWTTSLATVTVPWRDLHLTPGHYVAWIPFVSPPIRLPDMAANIVMFLPFGALYLRWRPGAMGRVLVWAGIFSATVEASQLFSRGRVTSTTDLATNVLGAMIGAFAWRVLANWMTTGTSRCTTGRLSRGRDCLFGLAGPRTIPRIR